MKKRKIFISECVCPDCGNAFPIPRQKGNKRKQGHLKTIWCPFCKDKVDMVERY